MLCFWILIFWGFFGVFFCEINFRGKSLQSKRLCFLGVHGVKIWAILMANILTLKKDFALVFDIKHLTHFFIAIFLIFINYGWYSNFNDSKHFTLDQVSICSVSNFRSNFCQFILQFFEFGMGGLQEFTILTQIIFTRVCIPFSVWDEMNNNFWL